MSFKYFENPEDAAFDFVLTGTDLVKCITASALTLSGNKVLQVDSNDFYGSSDASIPLSTSTNLPESLGVELLFKAENTQTAEFLKRNDRAFAIDISVPKLLFCKDKSVEHLIRSKVSKYMNFLSVKDINVWTEDSKRIRVPMTRNKIFQDKDLKLTEKRALMNLFKSAMDKTSTAIQSSAHYGDNDSVLTELSDPSLKAMEFLRSQMKIERAELISGIIHGVCMYPGPATTLLAVDLLRRIQIFIASLTQYEDECPLLIPMYGNSDIPQAFARIAAVNGALYILGCDEAQLRSELGPNSRWVQDVPQGTQSVLHGVACVKNAADADESVSVSVMHPGAFDRAPVFVITLPSTESSMGSPNVCPTGYTLLHFVQISGRSEAEVEEFKKCMTAYLVSSEKLFNLVLHNKTADADIFSLEEAFEHARITVNQLLDLPHDSSLPEPPPGEERELVNE